MTQKKKIYYILAGVLLLSLIIIGTVSGLYGKLRGYFLDSDLPPLHIAVAGPMSGESSPVGRAFINGARLYLDRVNQNGGINGRKLVLDAYDDHNQKGLAREEAYKIIDDNQAIAVIGHHYSNCSISAGQVYKENRIPAITPASTNVKVTWNNPWFFRSTFNDNIQGRFLANYAYKVFQQPTVSIIYEDDPYGSYLADTFEKTSIELGSEVKYKWKFSTSSRRLEDEIERIVLELETKKDAGLVFISTHAGPGARILVSMKDKGISNLVMGPDAFASEAFRTAFDNFPQEKRNPGFYTNDMYVATPLIFDTTDEKGQQFVNAYFREFGEYPGWHAAFAYDTTMVLVNAIRNTEITGTPESLADDRSRIRNFLAGMKSPEKSVEGVTGHNYFDENGDSQKPVLIGVYKNRNIVSALTQFRTVIDPREKMRLYSSRQEDRVFEFNGQMMYRVDVVYTGTEIREISEINFSDLTCTIEFFIWFRYQGDSKLKDVVFINATAPVELGTPIEDDVTPGRLNYQLYRIKSRFRMDFIPDRYTYGEHIIGVSFRHPNLDRNNLIYVKDVLGMGGASGEQSIIRKMVKDQALSPAFGWLLNDIWFFQDTVDENSLGRPNYIALSGEAVHYSRFNVGVQIIPDRFILRNVIPKKAVGYMMIFSGMMIVLLLFMVRHPKISRFSRLIWVFQLCFTFLLLLSSEYYMVNNLGRSYYLEPIIITFNMLWWLIPSILINIGILRFIWEPLEDRTGRPVPHIIRNSLALVIYMMATFGIVAFVFDQKLTSLLATSGVIAMIIGLAIQMNISNIFSGIAINVERPFRVGDWIKIDEFKEGVVVDINWRTTRIKTRDDTIICIPNSQASESPIENFSYPNEGYWKYFTVHVDTSHSPERIKKILLDAALATEGVEKEPPPSTRFLGLTAGPTGESQSWAANYLVSIYAKDYGKKFAHNEAVWTNIWSNLRRAGIKPVMQRQEMHMVLEGVRKPKAITDKSLVILDELDLFKAFSHDAKVYLSQRMKRHHFYPGESIVRQGDNGKSLFIIEEGVVGVRVKFEDKPRPVEVARMGAGNLFGEMGLLTGEPRTATIISVTETWLYEVTKEDIAPLLTQSPHITKLLSDILTERQMATEAKKHADEEKGLDKTTIAAQIFNRIQNFFGFKK